MSHLYATAGVDFDSITSQELVFNSTVTSHVVNLRILSDQLVEIGETLSAQLALQDGSLSSVIELNPLSTLVTTLDSNSEQS